MIVCNNCKEPSSDRNSISNSKNRNGRPPLWYQVLQDVVDEDGSVVETIVADLCSEFCLLEFAIQHNDAYGTAEQLSEASINRLAELAASEDVEE
jgi:hypothetical protein